MRESGYYPAGAEHDPSAPYNQCDPEVKQFTATMSFILTAECMFDSEQWEGGGVGCDEDGYYREPIEYTGSENDAINSFNDQHKTPVTLISEYCDILKARLAELEKDGKRNYFEIKRLKSDIADCELYANQEAEVESTIEEG